MSFGRDLRATLPSLLVVPIGLAIVKAAVDSIPVDTKPPEPLIPPAPVTPQAPIVPIVPIVPITPTGPATPAKPITPFITVKQRAEQAAFIARQAKQTREQFLGRFGL